VMKYVVLVGDGMAGYPLEGLGGKTPLMVARTPHMDWMAGRGEMGLVRTVPEGFSPGSEIANLSSAGKREIVIEKGYELIERLLGPSRSA